jgi:ABC-2 type transport system ATP-binding protein
MPEPFLVVKDLRKFYGSFAALDGVSFTVEEGEIFGLLGPNGAGKTTLLSILSCLLEATGGWATLQGKPLVTGNRQVRPLLGVVPQDLAIYGELTALENLCFFGELYGIHDPELSRRAHDILKTIGLEDRANDLTRNFSGGMKRRLNLGVALMHRPRLLLLDEPTVGVDPQSRNHLFEQVRRLNAEGMTIVYTSHYMEEVQTLCKRIGIIDQGRLRACDTLPNLLRLQPGQIRLRLREVSAALRDKLTELPGTRLADKPHSEPGLDGVAITLTCADVKATLIPLVRLLTEEHIEPLALETEEPNLERVFLSLTGKALRD